MANHIIIDEFVTKELKVPRTVAITESDAAHKTNCKVLRCFGPRYLVAFADGALYKIYDKDHKSISAPKIERRITEIFESAFPQKPTVIEIFPGTTRILASDLLMLEGKMVHLQAYRLRLEQLQSVLKPSGKLVCATPNSDPTDLINAPPSNSRQMVVLRSLDEFSSFMVNHVVTKATSTKRFVCVGETLFTRDKVAVLKRDPFVHNMQTPVGLQRLLLTTIASNLKKPIQVDAIKFEDDKKYRLDILNEIKENYLDDYAAGERVEVKYAVEDKGYLIAYYNPKKSHSPPFHIFGIVKKLSAEVDKSPAQRDDIEKMIVWDNQAFKEKCESLVIFNNAIIVDVDEKSKLARENIINTTATVVSQYSLSMLRDLPDPLSMVSTQPLSSPLLCNDSKLMRALRTVNEFVTSVSVGLNDSQLVSSGFRGLHALDEIVNAALTAKLLPLGGKRKLGEVRGSIVPYKKLRQSE